MNCDPFFNLVGVQKDLMCCLLKNNWPWPYTFWRIKAFLRWRCVSTVPLFLCVNCSSGPCCKLFLWSYVSSVSFFFLVLCLQRFSGSVNHLFLWSCVPTVSLFLNAYCSFIPECLVRGFPLSLSSCVPTVPLVIWIHCLSFPEFPQILWSRVLAIFSGPMWPLSLWSRVPTLIPLVLCDRRPSGHACPISLIRTREMKDYPFSTSFFNFRLLCCWIVINKLLV